MTKALLVSVDGSVQRVVVENLKDLQGYVGGYIETIQLGQSGQNAYVNEEGRLRNLPVNNRATRLIYDLQPHLGIPCVFGNMVIIGAPTADGEDTDVSESLCNDLGL